MIMKYVVAESHTAESAHELIQWYLLERGGDHDHVVRSFIDLVLGGVLCIDDGKVSPPRLKHAAQASVLRYTLIERHSPATIAELKRNLPFDLKGDEIELAVRELDRAELLTMAGAALLPGALLGLE